MIEINITVSGTTITAQDSPVIVCSNDSYQLRFTLDSDWTRADKCIRITCVQDADNTEIDAELTGNSCNIPALPACLAIRVYLSTAAGAAERRTDTLCLRCEHSIRDQGSTPYSAPFDAYNAMMEYANGKLTGSMTEQQLAAIMAQLRTHSAEIGAFPSAAYKRAIAALSPETKLSGRMTLADDTEIDITNDTLLSSSVGIATNAMRDNFILPGGVPAAELTATVMRSAGVPYDNLKGAKIELAFSVMQENGRWGDVPLGVFDIYGIGDDTATGTPITAYDGMKKLDSIPLPSAGFEIGRAYSPHQIIAMLAQTAGLDYAHGTVPGSSLGLGYDGDVGVVDWDTDYANNGVEENTKGHLFIALGAFDTWSWHEDMSLSPMISDAQAAEIITEEYPYVQYKGTVLYKDDLPADAEVFDGYRVLYGGPRYKVRDTGSSVTTARDLMMHTVASINAFAYIDRHNKLRIKPITKDAAATAVIAPKILRQKVSRLEYQTFSLTSVIDYNTDEGALISEQRTYETLWDDGVDAILPENPLYPTLDSNRQGYDITRMLINLTHRIDPVTFTPARVESYGDPSIDPYEWVDVPAETGSTSVPAVEIDWKYRGTQVIDSGGATAVAGLEQSQAEKTIIANKITSLQSVYNEMRDIYGRMMYTYEGLETFRYSEIEHYTYAQIERSESE